MPEGGDHDHLEPSQHQFLWNYELSDHDDLGHTQTEIAGLHALDVQAGHLFGAMYGSHAVAADGGLAIWDLADPAAPALTARLPVPGAVGGDRSIGATIDGDHVVLGLEQVTCFGHVNPNPVNVLLIDTSDKTAPMIVDSVTIPGPQISDPTRQSLAVGTHSVWVDRIGDVDVAYVAGQLFTIEDGALVDQGVDLGIGHDVYIRHTPWGDTWALAANGGQNFVIKDVTDPMAPRDLAVFDGQDGHYLHTGDVAFFEDQVIVIVSSEDWQDHVSPMWIFDVTELRDDPPAEPIALEAIGMWGNPGGHTATGLSFSLHNPRLAEDGILTISHYHGGLWQLDFRHADWRATPAEIAYAVYADGPRIIAEDPVFNAVETGLCQLGIQYDAPTYMDVELGSDGILYAADVYRGLYTFTPTAGHPVYGTV